MMACHYSQNYCFENRVGLHYSRFSGFLPGTLPENQRLTAQIAPRIREVGLATCVGLHFKAWASSLLSWTGFTPNFVIRNSHRRSALPSMQHFSRMIVAEGELM